jgi:hypothetical protein
MTYLGQENKDRSKKNVSVIFPKGERHRLSEICIGFTGVVGRVEYDQPKTIPYYGNDQ